MTCLLKDLGQPAMVEETSEDLVLYSLWFILINGIFM